MDVLQEREMARYLQRITLLGRERWIGWEIDGVGTEIQGLTLADDLSDEEIRARGVKEFRAMPFESFLGLGAMTTSGPAQLHDQDIEYRLDALLVGMERIRSSGSTDVPRALLLGFFGGDDAHLLHPRVQERFREWEAAGQVQVLGGEACYLKITGRLA
jgi:hypothetical protein